jgi:hypothetical protein
METRAADDFLSSCRRYPAGIIKSGLSCRVGDGLAPQHQVGLAIHADGAATAPSSQIAELASVAGSPGDEALRPQQAVSVGWGTEVMLVCLTELTEPPGGCTELTEPPGGIAELTEVGLIAELTAVDVGWNAELTWLLAPPPITASSSIETRERRVSFWKLRVFIVIVLVW